MSALLNEAQRLVEEAPAGTVSAWPRAAALLARQELEASLETFWGETVLGMTRAPARARMSCLRFYLHDEPLAADLTYTWTALTRATHHHPYELDPTRAEVLSLIEATRRITIGLNAELARRQAKTAVC